MKPFYEIVVLIPIGPNANVSFVKDTIDSINYYISSSCKIIVSDDSHCGKGEELKLIFPEIDVTKTQRNYGMWGGLYMHLSLSYRYAIENYDFKVLFKVDDDALIIGENPAKEVLELIETNPEIGMAGRLQSRVLSVDSFGFAHDNSYARTTILAGTCTYKMIKRPIVNWNLRKILFKAFKNGYELGESIFGGSYFITRSCLVKLNENGYLPKKILSKSILEEDHLFSLVISAIGFKLKDLSAESEPFAVAWKVLPASPKTLLESNKKIIHSVRSWAGLDEREIRNYFSELRK